MKLEDYKEVSSKYQKLGLESATDKDFQISEAVSTAINSMSVEGCTSIIYGSTYNDVFTKAMNEFRRFDDWRVYNNVLAITNNAKVKIAFPFPIYAVNIAYPCDSKNIVQESGKVECFKGPFIPDERDSTFASSCLVCALKGTNYDEFKQSLRFGDVLPLLFEMIMLENKNSSIRNYILFNRMCFLNEDINFYHKLNEINVNEGEEDIHRLLMSNATSHLIGMYYALILYDIYKSNPILILNGMKRVLMHEITTSQLLESLGVLDNRNDEVFNKELKNLKKIGNM